MSIAVPDASSLLKIIIMIVTTETMATEKWSFAATADDDGDDDIRIHAKTSSG